VEKYGKTPARWFYDLGTFDSPTFAAHCVWVTEEDMALMLEKGVSPVHNPTSNMKLGSGFAPVQRMLDLGLNVALGTDGAASNNNLNMLEELHLAAVLHNGYHRDPTILKPAQLLAMATRNGARLQGREDTGELAVGKKADIIALDLTKPHLYPNLDPLALTVYSAQGGDVAMTMVDGKVLYENGEFLTLDRERILHDAKAAVKRLYA
jgi:5-methylthioadenosine/S-adenosylhomocysteine deaminase